MNLRKVRVQLTAMYALLAALAVGALAWIAIETGTDGIVDSAEREAENTLRELAIDGLFIPEEIDDDTRPFNTWLVNPEEEWRANFGRTWVEPPLFTIAARAVDAEQPLFDEFEAENGTWLAYAEPFPEQGTAVITTLDLGAFEDDQRAFRLRVVLAAIFATLATTAAAWWVAGRSLLPAKHAMARQRDFIADAAHELRTPLAVIRASASHTLSKEREPQEYQLALNEILSATDRAGSGVGELLELARLDAGQALPRKAPLRVDLLVEEVASTVRVDDVVIAARSAEAIVVDADYALLRQVVESLTHNAAARSSEVDLSVVRAGELVTIQIADNGPGFDEDVLPHVFERFRRGDNRGSTGLGMAIAKSIVEAHGGTVSAANKTTGGAIVKLHLTASKDV